MQIVIRADASLQIGTGHVMRCLTLAVALKEMGAMVQFICRELSGNLIASIEEKGFIVHKLPAHEIAVLNNVKVEDDLFHASWLTVTQGQDAKECQGLIQDISPDWLIVDHYAIDYRWENQLKANCRKLMIIDDLADRKHECDLLLDQTYGRKDEDYKALVPQACRLLLGSQYALLRPEFAQWREYSLQRRATPELNNILISMGGVDRDNVAGQVLELLKACGLPDEITITVIIGATAQNLEEVKKIARTMRNKTKVKVDVTNMAELMSNADLAIGAAGATTWERCALGLPSIMITMADNQVFASAKLAKANIGWVLSSPNQVNKVLSDLIAGSKIVLSKISKASMAITDGKGTERICDFILEHGKYSI